MSSQLSIMKPTGSSGATLRLLSCSSKGQHGPKIAGMARGL